MNGETRSGHRWSLALVAIVLVLVSAPADAQWTRMPPPDHSPYWWTLTDEVSPAELRRQLQDRDVVRARFRSASQKGMLHQQVTEQDIHQIAAYIDGRAHPELVPMYVAFDSFAGGFEHWPGWREEAPNLLEEHGVSPEGVRQILDLVPVYRSAREKIVEEVSAPVAELMQLLRPWVEEIGNEQLMAMLVDKNFSELARITGQDAATLARLQRAWKREPQVEAGLPALSELRKELSTGDWDSFRAFLLAEVAPSMSMVEYREER